LVAKGVIPHDRILDGKAMLLQIVCMLSGLVDRYDQPIDRLREDAVEYRVVPQVVEEERKRKTKTKRKN
jgi:hypothetical protein